MSKTHCHDHGPIPRPGLEGLPGERELLSALCGSLEKIDAPVERLALGGRFVALRAGDRLGLASTLGAAPTADDQAELAKIEGMALGRAARLLLHDSPFLASLGLAALNAGFAAPPAASPLPAADLLKDLGRDRRVVVAGDFPFIPELREVAGSLAVLELRPGQGFAPSDDWARILGECELAAITGTSLLTRALAGMLAHAPQATTVLLGPSTPWAPVLFARGVDVLAGSVVIDPDAVMESVAQDLPFYEIKKRGVKLMVWVREGLEFN